MKLTIYLCRYTINKKTNKKHAIALAQKSTRKKNQCKWKLFVVQVVSENLYEAMTFEQTSNFNEGSKPGKLC